MMKKNVFSAIQPTGKLTIGHYIGVLKTWLNNQNKYNCFFCIADLHALISMKDKSLIKNYIYDLLSIILSIGIDPLNCIIFLQSDIIEHIKLYWLLNCYTYIGELNRMTQFKNKVKNNININCGLFNYPILMSSDILLYNSNYVPIGYDQIQHLELTRIIAKRINKFYSKNIFIIPNYIISKYGSKIMSLSNPYKKMSKSDINKNNVIFLLDNYSEIKKKIDNSLTDSQFPPKILYDKINKPGISNLLNIFSNIKNISINKLEKIFLNYTYRKFKKILIQELDIFLNNLQNKYFNFRKKEKFLKKILINGKLKAKKIAKKNILNIYKSIGINY